MAAATAPLGEEERERENILERREKNINGK